MIKNFLELLIEKKGSHLYLSPGSLPSIKIDGQLVKLGNKVLTEADTAELAEKMMKPEQGSTFNAQNEIDLAIDRPRVGRFSVNIFRQRNQVALVFRVVKSAIPTCKALGIPQQLKALAMADSGIILVAGAKTSGKAAVVASLVDQRNSSKEGHIITVEEPIEFVHQHKRSIVNQREVGLDTPSYRAALQSASRQGPDVIVIGEIRNRETMQHAIDFAQAGHLCIASLHAENAEQTLDRIISFFPEERHDQLYMELSLNILAMVYERPAPTEKDEHATTLDFLMSSSLVKDLIRGGNSHKIKKIIEAAERSNSNLFDSMLYRLFEEKRSHRRSLIINQQPATVATPAAVANTSTPAAGKDLGWEVEPFSEASY